MPTRVTVYPHSESSEYEIENVTDQFFDESGRRYIVKSTDEDGAKYSHYFPIHAIECIEVIEE